jgi:hypothetical protein
VIVKHIPARPAGRNATLERARHARNLVDYLRQPEKKSAEKDYQVAYMLSEKLGDTTGERLFHIGARNFVSTDIEGQRAEMIAVAQAASRSPNPIDHWLLSWREGELPPPAQIDETVAMFVEHLGVGDQPCIYACHGDTDNRHVHLALNRYDPLARRMIEINDGFTREAAHQAVALIADRFGWQAEADARYEVTDGKLAMAAGAVARQQDGRKSLSPKAAAFENRTGYRSAQRIVQEDAVPRIKAARSWHELHAALAEIGISYDIVGTNGVILTVDDERVKASGVDKAITRTRVEKRLGPFEPCAATIDMASRDSSGNRLAEAFRADEYRADCERWHKRRQAGLKRLPPDLEGWYYAHGEGAFAARWRHRLTVTDLPNLSGVAGTSSDLPVEMDGYHGYQCSDGVRYALGPDEPTAFLDRGTKIDIVDQGDRAMLSALRLAAVKFDGKVAVNGDAQFRERTFEIAQRNGLGHMLTDPDLAARCQAMQPVVEDLIPIAPPTIASPDTWASWDKLAKNNDAEESIVLTQDDPEPLHSTTFKITKSSTDLSDTSQETIISASTPISKAVSKLQSAREAAREKQAAILQKAWGQAFNKLGATRQLPVRDEAGRWMIDTAGLSDVERRAFADPERDADTQRRLADMDAAQNRSPVISISESTAPEPDVRILDPLASNDDIPARGGLLGQASGVIDQRAKAAGDWVEIAKSAERKSDPGKDAVSKGPAANTPIVKNDTGQER